MTSVVGRPKASSREVLAEAACELFLEQGYHATSVANITTRAGVSRSSFFNYFSAKSDVLWAGFDEKADAASTALSDPRVTIPEALVSIGQGFAPDALALAIMNAEAMGLVAELDRDRAQRQYQLQRDVVVRLMRDGEEPVKAQVVAGAYAAAVLAAVWAWADRTISRPPLDELLVRAFTHIRF